MPLKHEDTRKPERGMKTASTKDAIFQRASCRYRLPCSLRLQLVPHVSDSVLPKQ